MAKVKGNSLLVYVDGVAIGCLNGNEFSSENSEIDTTCKDNDGQDTSLPGGNKAEINFNGTFDTAATMGLIELLALHKNKTETDIRMGIAGAGGLYVQSSSAFLNSLTWSGPLNAATVFTGKWKLNNWSYGEHT
jgi:hypothetical protein